MWRRWWPLPVALAAAGLVAAILPSIVKPVHLNGLFVAANVAGSSPAAAAIWAEAGRSGPVPWNDVVVADLRWRIEGPAEGCAVNLLVLHDDGWQVTTVNELRDNQWLTRQG